MDAPTTAFSYAPIQSLHRDRTRRIHAVVQPNSPHSADTAAASVTAAADYCLAHHVLEGAEAAACARDTTTFDWYGAHPDANTGTLSTSTAVGPRIVINPDLDRLPRSAFSETPYYVLGPDTTAARKDLRELATAAYNTGAQTGFGTLLAAHAVVLVLLRHKQLGDTLDSWTITRLPGTVFSDHVDEPVVLARDLIHESGHNWLNDALAATTSKISDEAQFYSPWKKTMRPAFGFLHACWAFPLTMIYTARVLSQTTGALHQFLTAYLDQQRGLLAPTTDDHARVLALIPDAGLRQRLHAVHHEALSL
ncbi:HEXXH motif-containing putative peptide modification protein [Streptomyces sp. NEAU-S7GS2]|uniref:aKG-HExxH-type peptide beta-hydroxylase n=1 Tax=Streptomyces sp. NEAU-S7GS2 TaxID=2202000 RepID=UPI000D6F57A3|nr:HEXXH motif-containing putative peptide modification protein [Streptomyces sp. NEAU-S7GS2]AWN30057.1 HEXXH motif domain-containing protein [Streptomyces sp. NEAU-S7GS2]